MNIRSYESLPRSAPEVAIPERGEQLTVANTTTATESSEQHSTERTENCDNSKLESTAISTLSQDQDIDSASGYTPISSQVVRGQQGPPRIQNESYVKDTAKSDAYMIPCELLSESVDIDNLSPSESNYYLECFV